MQIARVYPYRLGKPETILTGAMVSRDGEIFGVLVNGRPVLVSFDGQIIPLPSEVYTTVSTAAALSPDGACLALGTEQSLKMITLSTKEIRTADSEPIYQLAWNSRSDLLVAGHQYPKLCFWNVDFECVAAVRLGTPRGQRCWAVTYSADEQRLFTASTFPRPNWLCSTTVNGEVSRFKLPQERYVHGLFPWQNGVLILLSDHTSRFELVAYTVDLKPQPVAPIAFKTDITALTGVPGSHWLAVGTVNGEVWILDAETFEIYDRRQLWHTPIRTMAACESHYVVAGAEDGTLKVLELM